MLVAIVAYHLFEYFFHHFLLVFQSVLIFREVFGVEFGQFQQLTFEFLEISITIRGFLVLVRFFFQPTDLLLSTGHSFG